MSQLSLFQEFVKSKQRMDLVAEAEKGNVDARQFLEARDPYPETFDCLGYSTAPDGHPSVFIQIHKDEYVLEIGADCHVAATDEDLGQLERELFDWAQAEGHFDWAGQDN